MYCFAYIVHILHTVLGSIAFVTSCNFSVSAIYVFIHAHQELMDEICMIEMLIFVDAKDVKNKTLSFFF